MINKNYKYNNKYNKRINFFPLNKINLVLMLIKCKEEKLLIHKY